MNKISIIAQSVKVYVPGDPQKSVSITLGLNFVLSPKSQSFKSMHLSEAESKVTKIFSGFKSKTENIDIKTVGQ